MSFYKVKIHLLYDSAKTAAAAVVQSLSRVRLFATPWTAAHQAPLSSTVSLSLLKFMSIESVMLANHLALSPFAFSLSQHQGLFQ